MPGIITKCFLCACFSFVLVPFHWVDFSQRDSSFDMGISSEKKAENQWIWKYRFLFFPFGFLNIRSKVYPRAEKNGGSSFHVKNISFGIISIRAFPKLSALVREYQYLYLYDTWQCKTLDTFIFCVAFKKCTFFQHFALVFFRLFFFSIFCTVSAILRTVLYPWPNDTHFLSNNAFCSTVSGQYQKCEESLSVQLSQLGYRNGLIHSYDRPLWWSPLLIVTFIRIRSTRFYLL